MKKKIAVLGGGFSGLAAAACLAKDGFEVHLIERHAQLGGRARQYSHEDFIFDMGPSWYWMPEVFEDFYQKFGKTTADFYDLKRLDPSYQVIFKDGDKMALPARMDQLEDLFETYEPGSRDALRGFLKEARYKYETGMGDFVTRPSHSILEFVDLRIFKALFRMQLLSSVSSQVRRLFKHEKLRQILEFPVLFLGAKPQKTPALYTMMNYADLALGTWYPMGGMHRIVEAMESIARDQGVVIHLSEEVTHVDMHEGKIVGIQTTTGRIDADIVVNAMDYHHFDQNILPQEFREYSASYWDKRVMAPSSLLFYLGVDKKVPGLLHHNLFFDEDFEVHATEIYEEPAWPSKPLFYVCAPSVTDPSVAPRDQENLFILIPVAPDLEENDETRDRYYDLVMNRLAKHLGQDIRQNVTYCRSYAHREFQSDYNAFKGNAYGLANTLMQTAFLKPKMKSSKIRNLWHTGQLTVPGPGVPPSLISGQVVAKDILKSIQ
jgi:phytoene desaturase